jgi:dTDP-4-amino-4,6-dideoxygalactose transaminase
MIRLTIPDIGDEEIQAVVEVLRSGYLVQGRNVEAFESRVAEYVGVKHAVAASSGTAALHLALLALGIGPGDEVIVPDFTFPATANVVERVGARAVLVDIDLATYNIDIQQIQPAITHKTRAILPVHLFGLPADLAAVREIARKHNLFIIEDAACALGARSNAGMCGSVGDLACFSFHPRKAITTGEGGMVVTNDQAFAERIRQYRNHGMVRSDERVRFELAGLNYRLTDFQGALGLAQMGRLETIIQKRTELAGLYHQQLAGVNELVLPFEMPATRHVWQSYVVRLKEGLDRDAVIQELRQAEIETTIGTYALSVQPSFASRGKPIEKSLLAYRQSLCLPLHPRMSEPEVRQVSACLKAALREKA